MPRKAKSFCPDPVWSLQRYPRLLAEFCLREKWKRKGGAKNIKRRKRGERQGLVRLGGCFLTLMGMNAPVNISLAGLRAMEIANVSFQLYVYPGRYSTVPGFYLNL